MKKFFKRIKIFLKGIVIFNVILIIGFLTFFSAGPFGFLNLIFNYTGFL